VPHITVEVCGFTEFVLVDLAVVVELWQPPFELVAALPLFPMLTLI
jgi:hypothetical protein